MASLFLWLYRIVGTLTIAAGAVVLVSQTEWFKDWFKSAALSFINDQLEGQLRVGDIRADIFRGIIIEKPTLLADGTVVFAAESIEVNYDLAAVFSRVIAISSIDVASPKIKLIRSNEGVWNFSKIAKPSESEGSSDPPNGTLLIQRFRVSEGHLWVNDRTSKRWSDQHFDPTHIELSSLDLTLSARINLFDQDVFAAVNQCSFTDVTGRLDVQALELAARVTSTKVAIQSLHVQLPESDVYATAGIDNVNLFEGFALEDLAKHPLKGHVSSDRVHGDDVQYIVPDVKLRDSYSIDADVEFSGTYVRANNVRLTAADATINADVFVNNLDGKAPLELDITVTNSDARYSDVRRRLAFVPLPDLPFLTRTHLEYVHLRGHPEDSLWFNVRGGDAPGNIEGEITLYLSKPTLGYKVDAIIDGGDLSVFSGEGDSDVSSALNGRLKMQGSGLTLQDLNGSTRLELSRSRFAGRPIRSLIASIRANGKGLINVDTLYANLTPFVDDSTASGNPIGDDYSTQDFSINGVLDASDAEHPRYEGNVSIGGLNLATIFRDENLPTMLAADLAFDVEGVHIDSVKGSIQGMVNGLALSDRALLPFSVELRSERFENLRNFALETSFGHVYVNGEYAPSALFSAIATSAVTVTQAVERRVTSITNTSQQQHRGAKVDPFRAHIDIDLLEVSPLNIVLPNVFISGLAKLDASVSASEEEIDVHIDSLYVSQFRLTSDSTVLYADPTRITGNIHLNDVASSPRVTSLVLNGVADSVIRFNDDVFRSPRIDIVSSGRYQPVSVSASSGFNTMNFALKATLLEDNSNANHITIDTLVAAIDPLQKLTWTIPQPATIDIVGGFATFSDVQFLRTDGEQIRLNGSVSEEVFRDFEIEITDFPLADILRFTTVTPSHPLAQLSGNVSNAAFTINGSWQAPDISAMVKATDLVYNRTLIGSLFAELHHSNKNIVGSATIDSPDSTVTQKPLTLSVGSLPIDLAFANVEHRLVPDQPIDVKLKASQLAMAAIEPFLPAVENVRGYADATINLEGEFPNDVKISGTASYDNARFLSSSTNMVYRSSGRLRLDGENLFLDTLTVHNMDGDLKGGLANGTGVVHFQGLAVDSIDLQLTTNEDSKGLKVLNNASQARLSQAYGDLIIRSGRRPIRLYGKLTEPHLDGELIIRYADVTFPQERSTNKARSTAFEYYRRDTAAYNVSDLIALLDEEANVQDAPIDEQQSSDSTSNDEQTLTSVPEHRESAEESSFVDDLEFNLDVFLEGRSILTMVFGTYEILRADLEQVDRKVPLTFVGSFGKNNTQLRGSLRVREGASTYKFYKSFTTSGYIDFTYGGITDPTLDLVAVHEGRRTINEQTEDFKVELSIKGQKSSPKIGYRVWQNNREVQGDSTKIAADALMLILVGRTQEELFESGQGNLVGQVGQSFSAVASAALSDILSGVAGIQSADFDIGSDLSTSRVTVSGQVFGDVTYRVSGQISDISGNNTFTLSLPLSTLIDAEAMRYLRADFSSTINNTGIVTRQTKLWEIKLGAVLP